MINVSDENLLVLFQAGNEYAFKEIFDRYDRLLFVYALKKLGNRDDAKDIVQEVFIKLWDNRSHLNINISLKSYLYSAVRNAALNIFRHRNIDEKCLASLQDLLDTHSDASDYLIREKDIARLIETEISLLPPKMREVFELRRKRYLSNREIAEYLQISEHTVATHIKRAIKVLRLRLNTIAFVFTMLSIYCHM